jgi:hypothetical protein
VLCFAFQTNFLKPGTGKDLDADSTHQVKARSNGMEKIAEHGMRKSQKMP